MKAIIVEDSRLARLELKKMLESFPQLEIIAESGEPDEAIDLINAKKPDLLFLDIQMPGKNGFELLDSLAEQPDVIFTTAYDEYAVRSFEYDAVDYLLKPIDKERLEQSIKKLDNPGNDTNNPLPLESDSSVFLKDGEQCWMVALNKITFFESCGNYTKVFFEGNKPLVHKSLNQLEKRLPVDLFFRANRQQIINIKCIVKVDPWINGNLQLVLADGMKIEISRRHTNRFKSLLSF